MPIRISKAELKRIVVSIDPAGSANEDSDDTGVIVCARGPHQPSTCQLPNCTGHGYVLDDLTCHELPVAWARIAVAAFDKWQADRIVAEVNFGAKMVEAVVRSVRVGVPFTEVTASRGKAVRAEPVSALWEQGRCHMIGEFSELEDELTTWTPDDKDSPNRLDALVWGMTHLGLVGGQGDAFITAWKNEAHDRRAQPPPELRSLPRAELRVDAPNALRPGCKHRWMEGKCVFCYGDMPNELRYSA